MKREEIKKIIKEETEAFLISEGILDSLIMMFLSPKIKKDVDMLKGSPEWLEWQQQALTAKKNMDLANERLEKKVIEYTKTAKKARAMGIKVKSWEDLQYMYMKAPRK